MCMNVYTLDTKVPNYIVSSVTSYLEGMLN